MADGDFRHLERDESKCRHRFISALFAGFIPGESNTTVVTLRPKAASGQLLFHPADDRFPAEIIAVPDIGVRSEIQHA